jgi:hypothetical protein
MTLTRTNWPDVDDLIAFYADGDQPMTPARVLAEEMPRLMAHNRRVDRLGSWVARDRETGCLLGWFMIRPVDQPLQTVELTYRLGHRAAGRGYDVEGIRSMIQMIRTAQVSTVMADDVTCRPLMEQAGLQMVQISGGDAARPTAALRPVRHALDLIVDARVPVSASPV